MPYRHIVFIVVLDACAEIPLAPQKVLTQFGLQGITARSGIIAFLTHSGYQSPGDYALAVYVMMSRARQLEDVFHCRSTKAGNFRRLPANAQSHSGPSHART